jgi:hypothetical protein
MKRKTKHRQTRVKTKLGLPDLGHAKVAVIVSLRSFESQRSYRRSVGGCPDDPPDLLLPLTHPDVLPGKPAYEELRPLVGMSAVRSAGFGN